METQKDRLENLTGVEQINGEDLVERKRMEGSIFTIIRQGEKHFLTLKNYRLTDDFNSEEELIKFTQSNMWELITVVICVLVDLMEEARGTDHDPRLLK